MKGKWFCDRYSGFGICVETKNLIFSKKSKYQIIKVFDTKVFGRMLVLDKAIQIAEKEEFIYHEAISQIPLFSCPFAKRVLIIGGGDGGTLREVLKHPVKEVFLVEIDKEVIEVSRKYFPQVAGKSFKEKRVKTIIGDGANFIKGKKNYFDIIIVDSSDPVGPAKVLFSKKFYKDIYASLNKTGLAVFQSGPIIFWKESGYEQGYANLKQVFSKTDIFLSPVATYPGALWSFLIGSKKIDPGKIPLDILKKRYLQSKIKTKHYNPEVHLGSFALPNFLRIFKK